MRRQFSTEKEIDYRVYKMSIKEYIKYYLLIFCIIGVFAYIFYKSYIAFFIMIPSSYFFMKFIKDKLNKDRKRKLTIQFKEFCMSLSAQLIAGYSMENAIKESFIEMKQMYGGDAYICYELSIILTKIAINKPIEISLGEFAKRSNIEDIYLFAEVISIAKRSGGDIIEIVKNAADTIYQKIEVEREIDTIINSKKFEQNIMNIVPILIVLYVDFTSRSMMTIMYQTIIGRIVMTVCLILYIFTFFVSIKISTINI